MATLTKRQKEILDFLEECIARDGYAPTLEEIGQRFDLSSMATVHKHLSNLEEKGLIRRKWNHSRAIEVATAPQAGTTTLRLLGTVAAALIESALSQPQVFVHRDFHSRNLMVTRDGGVGVIDFQDAVLGPVTYDLVSLYKDCYIEWPRADVVRWVELHRKALHGSGFDVGDAEQFLRWFDLMGLQRHLKVLGIFARLWYRDGKRGYLADLPLVLRYVLQVTSAYPELATFDRYLIGEVVPRFESAQRREGVL